MVVVGEKFLLLWFISVASGHFFLPPEKDDKREYKGDIAPRLLVSEYIKAGKIEEARTLSLVTGIEPNITSYSGFFTVDEDCGSNMFYWFFPSQNDWENDPVVVWLDGGPGGSDLYALLLVHGPYDFQTNGSIVLREYSWNRNSSVIYIDNPVGTGYSYTEKDECYATDEIRVGQNLLSAMQQFFQLFPELQKNDFFITGESYGGKFVPALGYAIHHSEDVPKINLKGLAIGDGAVDPINQLHLSEHLYQLGIVDENYKRYLEGEEEGIRMLIDMGLYAEANRKKNYYLIVDFGLETGYEMFYNFMETKLADEPDIATFLTSPEVREAIHVGNATFNGVLSSTVYNYLEADIQKSVRPWLEELVEHYRVVLYNGQMDLIVAYRLTVDYIEKMLWSGAEEYKTAPRKNWYVDGELAGYTKTVRNLTEILIRNSGHTPSVEQPKWVLDMHNRFIWNKPFE